MSLATYASPFQQNTNVNKNKRTSTISNIQSLIDENAELTEMKKDEDEQKEKNARVLNLMNKLKPNNDGSNLENFEPLNNKPLSNKVKELPKEEKENTTEGMTTSPSSYLPKNTRPEPGMFRPNNLKQENMSNLNDTYNGRISFMPKKMVEGLGTNEDTLAEKINYMIHLLEQQQAEKTDNIMEEFVLYAMLGVFVIFTVDSFTRAGRYVR